MCIPEKQRIACHITTFPLSKEGAACCCQNWAFFPLTAGRRGLYSPAPVGRAWPGSPCCVRNSSIIAQQLGYKVKIFEHVFKHCKLCPVLLTFSFVLQLDPDVFSIKNSVGPLQSDNGLNSSTYNVRFSPNILFVLLFLFLFYVFGPVPKPNVKKSTYLSCFKTGCVSPKVVSLWTLCDPL